MYRNTIFLLALAGIALPIAIGIAGCGKGEEKYINPAGYNFKAPHQYKLPLELDEISGVAFYAKDSSIFAINDEKGWLYKIKPGNQLDIRKWKFSSGADFEDLVLLDSSFYVLQSNGNIIKVSVHDNGNLESHDYPFAFGNGNEFEILYYDDSVKKMILICKDCESDKKKSLTTYTFDPSNGTFSDSSFSIDVNQIAKAQKEEKLKFKPSAAAINPKDGLVYIISSVNKLLVVTDRKGGVQKVYPIDPALFKQPEGISFTPSGTIIISNEAGGVGVADILIFSNSKI
jgi:uncharacterized protein YjiK